MACIFRRAIAQRIISVLNNSIACDEETAVRKLMQIIKVHKQENAKFSLDWNECNKILCQTSRELNSEVLGFLNGPKGLILADGLENVTAKDDGGLQFSVNQNYFTQAVLRDLYTLGDKWAQQNCLIRCLPRENVIVEFSSPNIAKTFHVGHLRSTIIGNALANIHEFLNYGVTRINYLGDWGTQYGLLSAGYERFGSEEELKKDPLHHLHSVYVASNSEASHDSIFADEAKSAFNRLERSDEHLMRRWQKFRDISIKAYEETYSRLGIHFDVFSGESFYSKSALEIVDRLVTNNLAERTSDGAVTIRIPYTSVDEKDVLLAKSDGSSLYLSRDVAAAIDRKKKYDFDKMYYVVDNRQSDHFVCVKNVLQKMNHKWHDTLHHIKFGLIHGMSSRTGNIVLLDDLLNEAKTRARESMEQSPNTKVEEDFDVIADVLGISGLIVFDLSKPRLKDYRFDWKNVLATSRNSGIALQYAHARLSGLQQETRLTFDIDSETNVLHEPEALDLVRHLAMFDEVLCKTIERLDPHVLVNYLFWIRLIGPAYKMLPVKGQDRVTAKARLLLFHSTRQVLNTGMKLIGLKPLDKM